MLLEKAIEYVEGENTFEPDSNVSEETPTKAIGEIPKKTKTKKTKTKKNRTFKELDAIAPRYMSEAEMRKYITELRTEYRMIVTKAEALDKNCTLAYEQFRFVEQQFADYKNKARAKLHFAKQAVSTCYNSIILAGIIEEE